MTTFPVLWFMSLVTPQLACSGCRQTCYLHNTWCCRPLPFPCQQGTSLGGCNMLEAHHFPQILTLKIPQLISMSHQCSDPLEVSHLRTCMTNQKVAGSEPRASTSEQEFNLYATCAPPSDGSAPFRCASEPCQ